MNISLPMAFLSGAPGAGEMILIFVVILLLFGPKRLPEIARMVGRTLDELRKASQDFKDQIMAIDEEPPGSLSGTDDAAALESGEYGEEGADDYYGEDWDGTSPDDDHGGEDYGYEEPQDAGDGFSETEAPEDGADAAEAAQDGESSELSGSEADSGAPQSENADEEDKHDLAG